MVMVDKGVGERAPSKKEMEEIFTVIDEAMEDDQWDKVKYLLDGLILLINTDTGGQAEFLSPSSLLTCLSSWSSLVPTRTKGIS